MTFSTSIKTCFTKYVDFSGRASRSEYWYFWLFNFLVGFVVSLLLPLTAGERIADIGNKIVLAIFLLPSLAVAVRRYHDTNHSGWWVICPIMNLVYLFYPSDEGKNKYGEMPEN